MKKILLVGITTFIVGSLNAQIIITGFMANPWGTDNPTPGTKYKKGSVEYTHNGGYEYIQLMATEDIDFSKTPYSVVTANNGGDRVATTNGWAEGGKTTFKFDLTEGKAAKGTFFYVGSPSKVIAGYHSKGKSADISQANWIRTIASNSKSKKVLGDGFGNAIGGTGILGDPYKGDSNTDADGIAVFKGTKVTPLTVPIDAIFYGNAVGVAKGERGSGYILPTNDHYKNQTGKSCYGEPGNTFFFEQTSPSSNVFIKLGGAYHAEKNNWDTPRKAINKKLSGKASTLPDIETGLNITQLAP
ncbi:hypothetical protein G5B30_14925 [Sphingobacterium sp. SGG-5]|uniref:hypothetical protein n=1 Tax=Sphingobacterium sp. SGG-5 TaxID=2710881 RepID=UPI0013E9EBA6|nr:hypothetical protein [Sphingobacterium sp. SGG-5]NGM63201.1 hypothetical protein [Sphingobacterium sp. SGG-5]